MAHDGDWHWPSLIHRTPAGRNFASTDHESGRASSIDDELRGGEESLPRWVGTSKKREAYRHQLQSLYYSLSRSRVILIVLSLAMICMIYRLFPAHIRHWMRLARASYLPHTFPIVQHGSAYYCEPVYVPWLNTSMTPYQLAESRRRRLLSSQPIPFLEYPGQEWPGLTLLFLGLAGLEHPSLWERWMQDGFEWLRTEAAGEIEERWEIVMPPLHDPTAVLNGLFHYPDWVDSSAVQENVPESLKAGILDVHSPCYWGNLNPCTHRVLSEGLSRRNASEWFAMLSADSIPIRSFRDIYMDLLNDRRSRIDILNLYFTESLPKASNWFIANREHATLLVEDESWLQADFLHISIYLQGAADEYAMFGPLLNKYGEEFFDQIFTGLRWTQPQSTFAAPLYSCWRTVRCLDLGQIEPFSEPSKYLRLYESGYDKWLAGAGQPFFMRKVVPQASVHTTGGGERTVLDFFTDKLQLRSAALHPEPPEGVRRTSLPVGYKRVKSYEQLLRLLHTSNTSLVRPDLKAGWEQELQPGLKAG